MGKRRRADLDTAPNPNTIQNREALQRLNFLYQTSVYLAQISGSTSSSELTAPSGSTLKDPRIKKGKEKSEKKGQPKEKAITSNGRESLMELSRQHAHAMKVIAKKSVLRMDPSVKRTICKKCQTVLIPGVSATVRVKRSASHGHATCYTCMSCQARKVFPSPPTLQPSTVLPPAASTSTESRTLADPVPLENASEPGEAAPIEEDSQGNPPAGSSKRHQMPKKQRVPRLPPLFQRDVGHVIFVGNEKTGHVQTY
ncbi:hypothetical protein FRB96_005121 [Tulasnella sp. 330]|nr:hypothetical protein FRB96_005121 [Tulasnella sp. 330]